jgi:hypothetical protein
MIGAAVADAVKAFSYGKSYVNVRSRHHDLNEGDDSK